MNPSNQSASNGSNLKAANVNLPPLARQLGYAGLIPFGMCALALWLADASYKPMLHQALVAYAAVILTFVGAFHWGLALARHADGRDMPVAWAWSVVPALVAWAALLLPLHYASPFLSITLIVCWVVDRALLRHEPFAGDFMRLRTHLTFAAWLCIVVGRMGSAVV
jgi:hypothetical protein